MSESKEHDDNHNSGGGGGAITTTTSTAKEEENDATTTTATSNNDKEMKSSLQNNINNKSKKRKRGGGNNNKNKNGNKPTILELQQERYDRLLYQAKKQLHKQAKQVRTFLTQKAIRKQQQQKDDKNGNNKNTTVTIKELPLDQVVHQALKQLGILHANPNPDTAEPTPVNNNTTTTTTTTTNNNMIQTCLAHKRFQQTLEDWNVKVTEYRRWSLQLEERFSTNPKNGLKGKPPSTDFVQYHRNQQQPTSMFCNLGGGNDTGDGDGQEDNAMSAYGPAAMMMGDDEPKRKNRKGQRARRAKAMALQAKREGKEYQSINWREPSSSDSKKKRKQEKDEKRQQQQQQRQSQKKTEPPPEAAHPSWAAKKEQSTGIVAFQGTKITF